MTTTTHPPTSSPLRDLHLMASPALWTTWPFLPLVRRSHGEPAPALEVAGVRLDPASRSVRWPGEAVELPAREFDVLQELMLHAGRVLSREQLQERVYRWGEEVGSNAIDVHVHHLRRKLAPELIRTVRGVGYLMPR